MQVAPNLMKMYLVQRYGDNNMTMTVPNHQKIFHVEGRN